MIEGIPDGWELVRIGSPRIGDWFINGKGDPKQAEINYDTIWPIIRKIEKPKRYRAFNDPIEAQPLIGEVLRLKLEHQSMGMFIGITTGGFQIGLSHWKPKEAFDCFERLDGTPFGIEVTE